DLYHFNATTDNNDQCRETVERNSEIFKKSSLSNQTRLDSTVGLTRLDSTRHIFEKSPLGSTRLDLGRVDLPSTRLGFGL
ncbi:unnamed protein product, partial [Rotaria magnacalcarata]